MFSDNNDDEGGLNLFIWIKLGKNSNMVNPEGMKAIKSGHCETEHLGIC